MSLTNSWQVSGQVVWARDGRFGLQFHLALTDDQVAEAVANEKPIRAEVIVAADDIGKDRFGRSLPSLKHWFREFNR